MQPFVAHKTIQVMLETTHKIISYANVKKQTWHLFYEFEKDKYLYTRIGKFHQEVKQKLQMEWLNSFWISM